MFNLGAVYAADCVDLAERDCAADMGVVPELGYCQILAFELREGAERGRW